MTRQEFYTKYGDVPVKFCSYYKYTFTYTGTLPDGRILKVQYGGDSSDIYRHEVFVEREETVFNLAPYAGEVYEGTTEIESFYDY